MGGYRYKAGRRGLLSKAPRLIRKQVYIPEPEDARLTAMVTTDISYAEHIRRAVSIYLNGHQKNGAGHETVKERSTGQDTGRTGGVIPRILDWIAQGDSGPVDAQEEKNRPAD